MNEALGEGTNDRHETRSRRVIVVMPAYNAEQTLRKTHAEVIAHDCVDEIILVDDSSQDRTVEIATGLERTSVLRHEKNRGYGANQKTCYAEALRRGADIVIMVHPDYQYTPKLVPALVEMIHTGLYGCVLGSRVLGGQALKGGMPLWRYVANRWLTLVQNVMLRAKLSEYHTGYRAFSREVLERLPLDANSDDFVFDNQMLAQILWMDYTIGEVSCPTRYATDASSIGFLRSVRYGFGCLSTSLEFVLALWRLRSSKRFPRASRNHAR